MKIRGTNSYFKIALVRDQDCRDSVSFIDKVVFFSIHEGDDVGAAVLLTARCLRERAITKLSNVIPPQLLAITLQNKFKKITTKHRFRIFFQLLENFVCHRSIVELILLRNLCKREDWKEETGVRSITSPDPQHQPSPNTTTSNTF